MWQKYKNTSNWAQALIADFFWLDKQQSLSLVVILAKIATNRDFTVSGMAVTLQQIFVILYKG
jgi:hypothetical protein